MPSSRTGLPVTAGKTAADALKLLGLERVADNILTSPELHRWVSFVDRGDDNIFVRPEFCSWVSFIIRRRNEGPVDRLLKQAMTYSLHAHYSDEALVKMVFAAMEVPSTRHTVATVEDLLSSEWRGDKMTMSAASGFVLKDLATVFSHFRNLAFVKMLGVFLPSLSRLNSFSAAFCLFGVSL